MALVVMALWWPFPAWGDPLPPVYQAAYLGDTDVVRFYITDRKEAIDRLDPESGLNLLHWAILGSREETQRALLDLGSSASCPTRDGLDPIQLAILAGEVKALPLLLAKGARPDVPNHDGVTALHLAAQSPDRRMLPLLWKSEAFLKVRTRAGETLLHAACGGGHPDAVQFLLGKGIPLDDTARDGQTPLHRLVLSDLNLMPLAPLPAGDSPPPPDRDAENRRRLRIARLLLDRGASPDLKDRSGCTPLFYAASGGKADLFRLLLEKGASLNGKAAAGSPLLHYAIRGQDPRIIETILKAGADPNEADDEGRTSLHVLVEESPGDFSAQLERLVGLNAFLEARTVNGLTPLALAVGRHDLETTMDLAAHGASLEVHSRWGNLPVLFEAIYLFDDAREFARLLAFSRNPAVRDDAGRTLLHLAASLGSREKVDILLEAGVPAGARSADGRTAADEAKDYQHPDLATYLQSQERPFSEKPYQRKPAEEDPPPDAEPDEEEPQESPPPPQDPEVTP